MRFFILVALVLATPAAFAHPGHIVGESLTAGLLHPLLGLDHMLAIVATGMWATLAIKHSRALGLVFLVAMAGGAALGLTGLALPYAEAGVLGSVIAAGLLLALLVTIPPVPGMLVTAAFALFHGNVHGLELPMAANAAAYLAGMLATTATVFLSGAMLARGLERQHTGWAQIAGALVVVGGLLVGA